MKLTVGNEYVGKKVLTLHESEVVVGRDTSCQIRIDSMRVSRRHCRIWLDESGWHVEDLQSRNGTWVNDYKVACPVRLEVGDRIGVGAVELCVSDCESAPFPSLCDLDAPPRFEFSHRVTGIEKEQLLPTLPMEELVTPPVSNPREIRPARVKRRGWWRIGAHQGPKQSAIRLPVELKEHFSDPAGAARAALCRRFDLGS